MLIGDEVTVGLVSEETVLVTVGYDEYGEPENAENVLKDGGVVATWAEFAATILVGVDDVAGVVVLSEDWEVGTLPKLKVSANRDAESLKLELWL